MEVNWDYIRRQQVLATLNEGLVPEPEQCSVCGSDLNPNGTCTPCADKHEEERND